MKIKNSLKKCRTVDSIFILFGTGKKLRICHDDPLMYLTLLRTSFEGKMKEKTNKIKTCEQKFTVNVTLFLFFICLTLSKFILHFNKLLCKLELKQRKISRCLNKKNYVTKTVIIFNIRNEWNEIERVFSYVSLVILLYHSKKSETFNSLRSI